MDLPIRVETRTGDTSVARKARQRARPPDILLTTPEQVALLLSHADAPQLVCRSRHRHPRRAARARADQARRPAGARPRPAAALAPGHVRIGLSATVARPSELRAYLVPQPEPTAPSRLADLVTSPAAAPGPTSACSRPRRRCRGPGTPRATPSPRSTRPSRRTSSRLVFVNTRRQAELLFQELWRINDDGLPIALHHGSLDAARRRKVEAAMAAGTLQGRGVPPPRSTSASTGATSTSSSMSARRRARAA